MADTFTITVPYKGEDRELTGELRVFGYSHRIVILVNEVELIFEPDEERNYRAMIYEPDLSKSKIDPQFVKAIAEELENAFR